MTQTGLVKLSFKGIPGRSHYTIETSADLVNWQITTNLTGTNEVLDYSEDVPASTSARFYRVATAPPNDLFTNRIEVAGMPLTVLGSNVGASKEPGEPNHANSEGGTSVWYSWTAPSSGPVKITISGTNFHARVGVYTGTVLTNLRLIASGIGSSNNPVAFSGLTGTNYLVAVDGASGCSSDFVLILTE